MAQSTAAFASFLLGVPWDQQPFFQALTEEEIPVGGQTTYDEPSPLGFNGVGDETSFIYGQRAVTSLAWPDLMFLLDPPEEWQEYRRSVYPAVKTDGNNNVMSERWPRTDENQNPLPARPLRDFPGLPDQISSNERWWRITFWRRLYPHISWEDILMRMQPEDASRTSDADARKRDSLNMQCCRAFNVKFSMVSWHLKGTRGKPRQAVLDTLTQWQRDNNTTRGSTPGLIDPALGEAPGNRILPPHMKEKQGVRVKGGRGIDRKRAKKGNGGEVDGVTSGEDPNSRSIVGLAEEAGDASPAPKRRRAATNTAAPGAVRKRRRCGNADTSNNAVAGTQEDTSSAATSRGVLPDTQIATSVPSYQPSASPRRRRQPASARRGGPTPRLHSVSANRAVRNARHHAQQRTILPAPSSTYEAPPTSNTLSSALGGAGADGNWFGHILEPPNPFALYPPPSVHDACNASLHYALELGGGANELQENDNGNGLCDGFQLEFDPTAGSSVDRHLEMPSDVLGMQLESLFSDFNDFDDAFQLPADLPLQEATTTGQQEDSTSVQNTDDRALEDAADRYSAPHNLLEPSDVAPFLVDESGSAPVTQAQSPLLTLDPLVENPLTVQPEELDWSFNDVDPALLGDFEDPFADIPS